LCTTKHLFHQKKMNTGKIRKFLSRGRSKPVCSAMNPIPSDPDFITNLRILRSFKKPFWIPVRGGSMRPRLDSSDFVRIVPLTTQGIAIPCSNTRETSCVVNNTTTISIPRNVLLPGMIVLVARSDRQELVLHRLVGVGTRWLFERGDKARIVQAFTFNDLLGYATHRRRAGKVKRITIPIEWRLRRLLSILRIGG